MKILFLIILICLPLIAFAQENVEDYRTKSAILSTYGEPFWKNEGEQRKVWYYPHQRMFIFFEEDKAVEIDVIIEESIYY